MHKMGFKKSVDLTKKDVFCMRGILWQIRRLYTTTSPKFFKFGSEVSPSEINKTQKNFWVLTSRGRDIGIWNFENLGVPGNFKHQYLSHEAWYKVIWGINLMLMNQTFKIRLLGIFFPSPKKLAPRGGHSRHPAHSSTKISKLL